jgi:hypothetical protein
MAITATIATTEIIISDVSDVHYKMQLTEIDPGPASIGMANGVKAISFLVCASLSTFLLTLCFTKFT